VAGRKGVLEKEVNLNNLNWEAWNNMENISYAANHRTKLKQLADVSFALLKELNLEPRIIELRSSER
jgi:hypothetical protein